MKAIIIIIFFILLVPFLAFVNLYPFTDDEGYFQNVYYRNTSDYFYIYCNFMESVDFYEQIVIEYKIDNIYGKLISKRIFEYNRLDSLIGIIGISDNEFIMAIRGREVATYYYFKDDKTELKINIKSTPIPNGLEILEDKSLIIGTLGYQKKEYDLDQHIDYEYYPILYFFSYPYGEFPDYIAEKNYLGIDIFAARYYKILSLNEQILLLCAGSSPGSYSIEIFDKSFNTIFIENYNISFTRVEAIDIFQPKLEDKDFFFYCLGLENDTTICNYGKFENNQINISASYINFNYDCYFMGFYQIENYKILGLFKESVYHGIGTSIFDFSQDTFKYNLKNIPIGFSPFNKLIVTYFPFKGYTTFSNSQYFEDYLYEGNINTICLYYNIEAKLNKIYKLNFDNKIYNIFEEENNKNFKIKFINIDKRLKLYKDKEEINKNDIYYNSNDNLTFIIIDPGDLNDLFIEYQILSIREVCTIKIKIDDLSNLYIDNKSKKCLLNNLTKISGKIMTNLNTIFNESQKYDIIINFEEKLEQNDLTIILNNREIKCNNITKNEFICEIPHSSFKQYNPKKLNKYKIYSYLKCKNLILLGKLKIGDRLVLDIFDAKNFTKISKQLKDNYNASEIIKKFNVNMINYYKRFSSYAYCDDDFISEGKCCEKMATIFSDWELVFHKEYYTSLAENLRFFDFSNNDKTLETLKLYEYNIVVFKSIKFKKIVLAFPGTTSFIQLIEEFLGCEQVERNKIATSKFFNYLYYRIKDDIKYAIFKYYKKDYQIIFTGHSLGGAMATLFVYEFLNYDFEDSYNDKNYKPILITFGQPRVGNEYLARFLSEEAIIFRIAKINDLVTIVPPIKPLESHQLIENIKKKYSLELILIDFISKYFLEQFTGYIGRILNLFIDFLVKKYYSNQSKCSKYYHTGGLYVLSENSDIFIHCADFFNEETGHDICKNNEIMSLSQIFSEDLGDVHDMYGDYIMNKCQYNKGLDFFNIK